MAVMKTHISWTDSTWNPTTGCTKVSAGCEHCYAEYIVEKRWKQDFKKVVTHADRLSAVSRFKPLADAKGRAVPRRVFVNSMSDLMHSDIPDSFRDDCFDAMERQTGAVFQVLTKRPITMARYIERRYAQSSLFGGMPDHIWLGVSVEDNRVRSRIDTMRSLKARLPYTLFLSIEPLIGPPDKHDYDGVDQVLIGGESGFGARDMQADWARVAVANARRAGAAVWFKQWGQWKNNPLYQRVNAPNHVEKVRLTIALGEKLAAVELSETGKPLITGEKGGATLDGKVLREMPPMFEVLTKRLRGNR